MKLSDFEYTLPPNLIAKYPVEPRDSSKLLVLDKNSGKITDDHFYNLANYLNPGDLIIRNNTKVIPARIFGQKASGGNIEVLLIKKIAQSSSSETWECLTKPGVKVGQTIFFDLKEKETDNSLQTKQNTTKNSQNCTTPILSAVCTEVSDENYTRVLEFDQMGPQFVETLEKIGITPLPPYIANTTNDSTDIRNKYQTIYAKIDGSAAAPTAGLHFTSELEEKILNKGIQIAEVTLHVGLGTFLPVKTENILEHHMHSEWFELKKETAQLILETKQKGNKVVCIGTTSARVLESAAKIDDGKMVINPEAKETNIFMYPGYKYKCVDALITNFHLPKSTLLMLVSAFVSAPNTQVEFKMFLESNIGKAYIHAIKNGYRFYSFGDAMLVI